MPDGLQVVWLVAAGIVVLFAIVMVLALRLSRRARVRNLGAVTAATIWKEAGHAGVPDATLLYGLWEISLHEVVLMVKDAADRVVGQITQRGLGGLDTLITIGPEVFRVVPQLHWREAANLMAIDSPQGPGRTLCRFTVGADRTATYTCEGRAAFTVRSSRGWPWRRHVSGIWSMGNAIGTLWSTGPTWLNQGRALLLPVEIPLAVRLFVLCRGTGLGTRPVTR